MDQPPASFSGRRCTSVIDPYAPPSMISSASPAPRRSSAWDTTPTQSIALTASDISSRRASETTKSSSTTASGYPDAVNIAARKASACDDEDSTASMSGTTRGSISAIAGRIATALDRPPWDLFSGAPPGYDGSTWGWMSESFAMTSCTGQPPSGVGPTSGKKKQQTVEYSDRSITGQKIFAAQTFTFRQMANATNNFSIENLVGEGGFGRVYKGYLQGVNKVVAMKQLDRNGLQGNRQFLIEVLTLSLVDHPNLVNLIGYCADGDQRILVYEYMAFGSLEDHLLDLPPNTEPLSWQTRMKIAEGAAKGLEYLHETSNPPLIYRDFKASNILLDEEFNPKLSDFGLAKLGPTGDKEHVSTRVMGTYGYCAPEYAMTGKLTTKSDVYSFGVVFLELISGRRAVDTTKPTAEQNLISWAEPLFKDRKMFTKMADPLLKDKYPVKSLYHALAVAAMCLQEEASTRPLISDVVTALAFLSKQEDDYESPRNSVIIHAVEEEDMEDDHEEDYHKDDEDEDDDKKVPQHGYVVDIDESSPNRPSETSHPLPTPDSNA